MSEARGTYVSIYLKDEATKHLQKIDKLVGEVERSFMNLGQEVDESTADVDSLTKAVQKTSRELKDSADSADSLTNSLIKSEQNARDVQKASAKIETELEGSTKEAQSLTTQLTTAKTNMGALSQEANQVDASLQNAGNSASNLSGIIAGIGLGAAVTGIVSTASEFESAMGRIEAKTALTGAELERLEGVATDVFTSGFGESITGISDDMSILSNTFKGFTDTQLTNLGKGIYTVTDLWGQDFNEVSRTISVLQKNFEGLGETEALDAITYGFQNNLDFSGELLDTLREYSPQFSEMGMGLGNMISVLQSGTSAGAWSLDKIGDSIKESHLRMGALDKATVDAYTSMGLNADEYVSKISKGGDVGNKAFQEIVGKLMEVEDATLRNQLSTDLFGTQYEDLQEKVIFAMAEATTATAEFGGATETATKAMQDNFGTDLLTTVREFKTEIGQMFSTGTGAEAMAAGLGVVKIALDGAKTGLQWVLDNGATLTAIIAGVGASFATFQVISMVNMLLTAYKTSAFASTLATQGFNAALRANPIGMVVTLIGLLVAGGVLLYQNWDVVKTKAGELWGIVKEKFTGIKQAVSNFIQPALGWFDSLSGKWNTFKAAISNFKVPEWMSKIGGAISSGISKVKSLAGADGSHATGLARVSHDGYIAETHKDESILTAAQSDTLRGMGVLSSNGDGTPNLNLSPLVQQVAVPGPNPSPSIQPVSTPQLTQTSGPTISISAPINLNVQGNADDTIIQSLRNMLDNDVRRILSELINQQLAGLEG